MNLKNIRVSRINYIIEQNPQQNNAGPLHYGNKTLSLLWSSSNVLGFMTILWFRR